MEEFVWSNEKPWIPRPLLSMHVRMGDKACEMKVVEFEEYMHLADRIRKYFPDLNSIWLSTEMQVYFYNFFLFSLISYSSSLFRCSQTWEISFPLFV